MLQGIQVMAHGVPHQVVMLIEFDFGMGIMGIMLHDLLCVMYL